MNTSKNALSHLWKEVTMRFEDLTPEQREKAKACKTPEEILSLAKEAGYKLSDEELENISGGGFWCFDHTPSGEIGGAK